MFCFSTFKHDCPAFVKLSLSRDKQKLRVTETNFTHVGHEDSQEYYEYLPENRQLDEVLKLLKMKCPVKMIQNELIEDGKIIKIKDIQNLRKKINENDDDLEKAINLLENTYGASAHVILDSIEDGNSVKTFKGLYFSTATMRKALKAWPEIVFIDTTYNLSKWNMSVAIMAVSDGNGYTHIVAVGFLTDETEETLSEFIKAFQNDNKEVCHSIKSFMTNKDLTERKVLKTFFPKASLFLCEFHVLRIFKRTVTPQNMNMSRQKCNICLNKMSRMTKSLSQKEYEHYYNLFRVKASASLIKYFDKNWNSNISEWTRFSMSKENYNNYTNNAVESINGCMKKLINKRRSLCGLIRAFFTYYKNHNDNKKIKLVDKILKRPNQSYPKGSPEQMYSSFLTSKASKIVVQELLKSKNMTYVSSDNINQSCTIRSQFDILNVTTVDCSCVTWNSNALPCRHIFAIRRTFDKPLFDLSLCGKKWHLEYDRKNQPLLAKTKSVNMKSTVRSSQNQAQKRTNYQSRRNKASLISKNLVNLMSQATGARFERRLQTLINIGEIWKDGEDVDISNLKSLVIQNLSNNFENIRISTPRKNKIHGKPKNVLRSAV
uniref:SWIM-type domain-containing protein n=1 Tax=Trichogramma kaykai TaxID=54128 RepID=A0ABD2WSM7_9HYME